MDQIVIVIVSSHKLNFRRKWQDRCEPTQTNEKPHSKPECDWLVVLALLLLIVWYWKNYLTNTGEVSHFEAKIRREVDPDFLQSWATNLLQQYSQSNSEPFYPIRTFPKYMQELSDRPIYGWVRPGTPETGGAVGITWGSGMLGHWGLRIGYTNANLVIGMKCGGLESTFTESLESNCFFRRLHFVKFFRTREFARENLPSRTWTSAG